MQATSRKHTSLAEHHRGSRQIFPSIRRFPPREIEDIDRDTMAAMGRDAAMQTTTGTGRRQLPNGPRSRETIAKPPKDPLEDAMASVRALDKKLRGQLEKDKRRMNMHWHNKNSDSGPPTESQSEHGPQTQIT